MLVHGLGVSSRYWVPAAERLAAHRPVLAPDLPGYGRSENPPRALDLAALADALAAWMDAVGLGRAALLGNSLGCQVIAEFVLRHPGRAACAVFAGPTVDPAAATVPRQVARAAADVLREPLALYPILVRDYFRFGPAAMMRTLGLLVRDPFAAKLPLLDLPVLVVRGEHDRIVPQRWAEEAARRLPRGRLVVLAGGAHAAHFGRPDAFVAAVEPFLRECG